MAKLDQLFIRPDIHPVVLDVALTAVFGPEWISWDGDSTSAAITRQFGSLPSRQIRSKVYALGVLHANRAFWQDWRAFEACCWALMGKSVDLYQMNPLGVLQAGYGIRTAKWIDHETPYAAEIEAYVAVVLLAEQFSLAPPEFSAFQATMLKQRPDLRIRAEAVKSRILSGDPPSDQEVIDDPIKVEVTRHRMLDITLDVLCSADSIMSQARLYGLDDAVKGVVG